MRDAGSGWAWHRLPRLLPKGRPHFRSDWNQPARAHPHLRRFAPPMPLLSAAHHREPFLMSAIRSSILLIGLLAVFGFSLNHIIRPSYSGSPPTLLSLRDADHG